MNSRFVAPVVSLAALIAASLPVASHANDQRALERCAEIFAKEVVPAHHSVEIRHDEILASTRVVSATRSRVTLIARGEKHSEEFGRASCVVDRSGLLVAVYLYDAKAGSMGSGRPRVLARNVDTSQGSRTAYADDMKPF